MLCNKIPVVDDMDGGVGRRIKCMPYESTFVLADSSLVGTGPTVHVMDKNVEKRFVVWRMCLMRRILEAADTVAEPKDVVEHTGRLLEREDVISQFVKDVIKKTGKATDVLRRSDVWDDYTHYCKGKHAAVQYHEFNVDIARVMGEPTKKSGSLSNFWRGYVAMGFESAGADMLEM